MARVRLWVDDGAVASLGADTRVARPISRRTLRVGGTMPVPPSGVPGTPTAETLAIQQRLVELGYLPSGIVPDGRLDARTRDAVIAFQKWERLLVDGIPGAQTLARLAIATRPLAPSPAILPGRRIEVDLSRQVLLLIGDDGVVLRAIHVSTGRARTPTPPGVFTVFRRVVRSWSVPYQEWLPWALYFAPGLPIRAATTVALTPTSRGSVRVPWDVAAEVHAFGTLGTPVVIRAL